MPVSDKESAREDWESLACNMKESLSSSTPRSGEVEEEDDCEFLRSTRLGRVVFDMVVCLFLQVLLLGGGYWVTGGCRARSDISQKRPPELQRPAEDLDLRRPNSLC